MQTGDASRGARVASLAGPKMPADYGLTSLGLLMELGGSLFLVTYCFLAISIVMAGARAAGDQTWWMFLFAVVGAVRSAFHRQAGRAMLYSSPKGPLQPTRVYIAVSVVHTLIALYAMHKLFAPMGDYDSHLETPILSLLAAFLAWPATLAIVITRPRFRSLSETEMPNSEDMGFEGTSVLMVLMGTVGLLMTAFMLIGATKAAGSPVASGPVFFSSMILVVLGVRSFLHVKAGFSGVRGDDPHTFHDRAQSYYNFGVIASIIAGAGMFIMFLSATRGRGMMQILPMVALLVYMLTLWPMMLRRFFTERNFSLMMAGDQAPTLRRAPDAGLTALGWLLLATSVTAFASQIASLISTSGRTGNEMMLFAVNLTGQLAPSGIDRWLPVIGTGLQLWAAIELVSMSERHRVAATLFGVFGIVSTVVVYWDVFKSVGAFGSVIGRNGNAPFGAVDALLPVVMSLVAPVATLLLVHRKNIATARVVSPPQQR